MDSDWDVTQLPACEHYILPMQCINSTDRLICVKIKTSVQSAKIARIKNIIGEFQQAVCVACKNSNIAQN